MGAPFSSSSFRASWQSRRASLTRSVGERWYLVQSLARSEAKAEFHLAAQNYRVYWPWSTKTVRHARQLRSVKAAVFPGYMFVILDTDHDQWRSINGTFGVARIVAVHDRPSPVPDGLVEAMFERTDMNGETHLSYPFSPGQSVRVTTGPFSQLIGTLDRLDANGRVSVLLQIMGGTVPVQLMGDNLEPAHCANDLETQRLARMSLRGS